MTQPFQAALEYLRAERAELDYVIASLERRVGKPSPEAAAAPAKASKPQPKARKQKPRAKLARRPRAGPAQGPGRYDERPRAARGPNAAIAEWRSKLIAPILAHPKGSDERRSAFKALAGTEVPGPDGQPRFIREAALYLYVQQAEGTVGSRGAA
jgi:hypothetical protein